MTVQRQGKGSGDPEAVQGAGSEGEGRGGSR